MRSTQGHFYVDFVKIEFPMLYYKFQDHHTSGSEDENFKDWRGGMLGPVKQMLIRKKLKGWKVFSDIAFQSSEVKF